MLGVRPLSLSVFWRQRRKGRIGGPSSEGGIGPGFSTYRALPRQNGNSTASLSRPPAAESSYFGYLGTALGNPLWCGADPRQFDVPNALAGRAAPLASGAVQRGMGRLAPRRRKNRVGQGAFGPGFAAYWRRRERSIQQAPLRATKTAGPPVEAGPAQNRPGAP